MKPDYRNYSVEELVDVYNHINYEKYPDRHQELMEEIDRRKANGTFSKLEHSDEEKSSNNVRVPTKIERIVTTTILLFVSAACVYYGKIPFECSYRDTMPIECNYITQENNLYIFWSIAMGTTASGFYKLWVIFKQ